MFECPFFAWHGVSTVSLIMDINQNNTVAIHISKFPAFVSCTYHMTNNRNV